MAAVRKPPKRLPRWDAPLPHTSLFYDDGRACKTRTPLRHRDSNVWNRRRRCRRGPSSLHRRLAFVVFTIQLYLKCLSKPSCWKGRYTKEGTFSLTRSAGQEEQDVIVDEDEIVRILHGEPDQISCVVCTDDYHWWKDHGYAPWAGKPVWLDYTAQPQSFLPIFFDDKFTMTPKIPSLL